MICDVGTCLGHIRCIKGHTPYSYNEKFLNTFYHQLISERNSEKNM